MLDLGTKPRVWGIEEISSCRERIVSTLAIGEHLPGSKGCRFWQKQRAAQPIGQAQIQLGCGIGRPLLSNCGGGIQRDGLDASGLRATAKGRAAGPTSFQAWAEASRSSKRSKAGEAPAEAIGQARVHMHDAVQVVQNVLLERRTPLQLKSCLPARNSAGQW